LARIKYSSEALNDLTSIKSYITNDLQNPNAAERVNIRILRKNRLLETAPKIGAPLSSVIDIDTDYRFLIAGNYLSFYRYTEIDNTCYIDRVLYKRRDYMTILFGNHNEPEYPENDEDIDD